MNELVRYSIINNKDKREIVLLRATKCRWGRCRFCDYHLDSGKDEKQNFELNKKQLDKVTGIYKKLEVVNSGSFLELDKETVNYIKEVCRQKNIKTLIFESHWMYRKHLRAVRETFEKIGVTVKVKTGIETFDYIFRESYLVKGIDETNPEIISKYFDQVCLLFGLPGQSVSSMINDIEIGLSFFERVCVNIMQKNSAEILPDPNVIADFVKDVFPKYADNQRIDIMLNNTDFGIGGYALDQ